MHMIDKNTCTVSLHDQEHMMTSSSLRQNDNDIIMLSGMQTCSAPFSVEGCLVLQCILKSILHALFWLTLEDSLYCSYYFLTC